MLQLYQRILDWDAWNASAEMVCLLVIHFVIQAACIYLKIRLEIQAITFKKKETSEGLLPTYFRGHSLTTLTRVWGRACQRSPRNYYFGLLTFCLRFVSHLPKLKDIAPCYVTQVLYDMN